MPNAFLCAVKGFMYVLPSVCLRLSQFSQLSFMQNIGECVFSLPSLWWFWEYVCFILVSSSNRTICHCLWLGHKTMVYAVYFFVLVPLMQPEKLEYLSLLWYILRTTDYCYHCKIDKMEKNFFIVLIMFYIYLNASQYDNTLFSCLK